MKKVLALLLTLVCLLAGSAACSNSGNGTGGGDAAGEDYTVQMTASAALCGAPIFIAMEMGYLEEFGVKYNYFNSETSQWDLMAAGRADMAYGLLPTFIQRIANGFELNVVMGAHYGCINIVATEESGIRDVSDLAGRTVGIPGSMGSDPAIMLQRTLVAHDIKISDVNMSVFNNADLATALQEGFIEAFISWDPYATLVSQQEGNLLIFNQAEHEATADEFCCLFGLRPAFLEEHPDMARRFIGAMAKACEFIAENPEEAARISYEKGYIADADYEFNGQLLDSYRYEGKFSAAKESFVRVAEDLINLGIISDNITSRQMADKVFINIGEID